MQIRKTVAEQSVQSVSDDIQCKRHAPPVKLESTRPSYLFNQTLDDRQSLQRRAIAAARQQPVKPQRHQGLQGGLGLLDHVKRCRERDTFSTYGDSSTDAVMSYACPACEFF